MNMDDNINMDEDTWAQMMTLVASEKASDQRTNTWFFGEGPLYFGTMCFFLPERQSFRVVPLSPFLLSTVGWSW